MIRTVYRYFTNPPVVPAVYWNGGLYVSLAIVLFWQNELGSDEAGKYLSLEAIWYLKLVVGTLGAALLSIKLFMSNNYAEHQADVKKQTGNTELFVKTPEDK